MATVFNVFEDVILEKKSETLKVFYDMNILIQDYGDSVKKEEPEEENTEEPEESGEKTTEEPEGEISDEEAAAGAFESFVKSKGKYLTENIYRQETKGEVTVSKEEANNIQTFQDLIEFLARTDKADLDKKQTPIEKILGKEGSVSKEEELTSQKIISPIIREAILLLIGSGGEGTKDLINDDDKVVVDIDYGHNKSDCIGFRITKNPGTEIFSTVIKKDGEVLSAPFNLNVINKQILYYRNSIQ